MTTSISLVERLRKSIGERQVVRDVDLSGAALRRVDLTGLVAERFRAPGACFEGALLTDAQLMEADLSGAVFDGAHMVRINLGLASLDRASVRGAFLAHSILINAFCEAADMTRADLTGADLEGCLFSRTRLDDAILCEVNAPHTRFTGASIIRTDMRDGIFVKATFNESDLSKANLSGSNCSLADFRGAKLYGVNWSRVRLDGALFDPWAKLLVRLSRLTQFANLK